MQHFLVKSKTRNSVYDLPIEPAVETRVEVVPDRRRAVVSMNNKLIVK